VAGGVDEIRRTCGGRCNSSIRARRRTADRTVGRRACVPQIYLHGAATAGQTLPQNGQINQRSRGLVDGEHVPYGGSIARTDRSCRVTGVIGCCDVCVVGRNESRGGNRIFGRRDRSAWDGVLECRVPRVCSAKIVNGLRLGA
jgi:hypothetical protein